MQIESTILLLAILQLLGAGVIAAVAPDDQQSQCTSTEFPTSPGHGLVGAYTNTQKPLMDSYWYNPLAGSNGVWHLIHENVDTTGWRRGQITTCRNTVVTRHSSNAAENNWFSTQFISRSTAQTPTYNLSITVNVSYSFLSCVPKRFRLHGDSAGSISGIRNYIHIGDVNTNTTALQTSTFTFNLGSQYSGFWLGFQDQDSCSTIERVQVYRTICPSRTEGLVIYPETPTGTSAVSVTHQCTANADVNGVGLMCNTDGSWSGSPSCSCAPGHILNGGNCQACPAGTYQSGSFCLSCPANTVGTSVEVAECPCQDNYYRAPSDSLSDPCTVPPTKVQGLQAPGNDLTNTSIRIQWIVPATTGGRSDLVYQISYRRIGTEQVTMRTTTQTSYQLTGLQPLSEYTITVVSANGITEGLPNVAAITLQNRTVTISASTTEGVPGPLASVAVVDRVVIWQPPQSPNGNLLGYIIRVYSAGNIGQAQTINVGANPLYHKLTTDNLPAGNNLQVQVRGRTTIGAGDWSVPQPLSRAAFVDCSVPPITSQSSCPFLSSRPVRLICEEITASVGNMKTPSYPSQAYPNNADYIWTIKNPDFSKAVKLTFHGTFDIEYTRNCSGSYLEVRDGDSPDSVLVGKYCGSVRPSPIKSSTNFLYIHFHSSNNQTTNIGFNATFASVETTQGRQCNRLITALPYEFASVGFPAAYNGSTPQMCRYLIWNIRTHIDLRFLYTDLKNCSQGTIEVYEYVNKVATICNADDAQQVFRVNDFVMNIVYTIKVPGLRGFTAVLNGRCSHRKELSRNGTCI